uniref:Secreted protein n=1 Tax=Steinernema glaseri TaxID=37863 RepID=A0A1I8ALW8_9BILA
MMWVLDDLEPIASLCTIYCNDATSRPTLSGIVWLKIQRCRFASIASRFLLAPLQTSSSSLSAKAMDRNSVAGLEKTSLSAVLP